MRSEELGEMVRRTFRQPCTSERELELLESLVEENGKLRWEKSCAFAPQCSAEMEGVWKWFKFLFEIVANLFLHIFETTVFFAVAGADNSFQSIDDHSVSFRSCILSNLSN